MKTVNKILTITTGLIAGAFLLVTPVVATIRCETQYGGGQTCTKIGELLVEKKVLNPDSSLFVDNLGLSDYKFAAGDEIKFRIIVKNTGDAKFDRVTVTDTLPDYLYFTNGPSSWTDRVMTFTVNGLEVNESKEYEIKARVVEEKNLPDKNLICKVNSVKGMVNDQTDSDTAQVCIEKKVLAKVLPVTGPSVLPLIIFTGLIAAGFVLNKKSFLKI